MTAEIIRVPFAGALVSLHRKDDDTIWMTREELSMALGFSQADGVRHLERNHAAEIAPFKGCVDLRTPGGVQEVVDLTLANAVKVGRSWRVPRASVEAVLRPKKK